MVEIKEKRTASNVVELEKEQFFVIDIALIGISKELRKLTEAIKELKKC